MTREKYSVHYYDESKEIAGDRDFYLTREKTI